MIGPARCDACKTDEYYSDGLGLYRCERCDEPVGVDKPAAEYALSYMIQRLSELDA